MLRVLRLTRVNHRTIPQTHRLVACALTPRARSAHEFIIKKNHSSLSIPLHSPMSQRLVAALSWTRTRTPLAGVARPIRCRSFAPRRVHCPLPPVATLVSVVLAPPARPTQARCWWWWC
jgi:hypothetical protein